MNYNQAVQAANEGRKVARSSWKDEGYIIGREGRVYAEGNNDDPIYYKAEPEDVSANDWEVVPEPAEQEREDTAADELKDKHEGDDAGDADLTEKNDKGKKDDEGNDNTESPLKEGAPQNEEKKDDTQPPLQEEAPKSEEKNDDLKQEAAESTLKADPAEDANKDKVQSSAAPADNQSKGEEKAPESPKQNRAQRRATMQGDAGNVSSEQKSDELKEGKKEEEQK